MTTLVDNRRASLARYAPWIARDYFMNQGPGTAIVMLLLGWLAIQTAGGPERLRGLPDRIQIQLFDGLVGALAFLGTFFATNGIIANDRKFSWYRFLFSKPVSPLAYYLTVFGVYAMGVLTVSVVLLGIWSWLVKPMLSPGVLGSVLLTYLLYGGIGFLLSAAVRFDWMSLVTVLFVSNVLWSFEDQWSGFRLVLLHLLPPVHRAGDVLAAVLSPATPVPWGVVAWAAGYGVACLLLGLVVLRKRAFGSG